MDNPSNGAALTRAGIAGIVMSSLEEVLVMANGDAPSRAEITEDTRLIGREAVLDSMGLVNLIVEVEQYLEEEHDITLVLANDRAMSQQRSPFRSVQTLTDYIFREIEEQS